MSTLFDRYHLINHIARMDKHDVYLAYHLDTPEQRVVLKVFDTECLMPEKTLHDFKHMTKKLRQLTHPYILPFYTLGIEQKKPYIVTDYVSGESLRVYLDRSQQLHFNDAVEIVKQVGEAVAFAHSQQIIHQDIRPENIFFDAIGNTLLTDFRLPHLIHEDYQLDDSATHMISYRTYKAPEQVAGIVHPAADQYALGCLLYELITGTLPFANMDVERQEKKEKRRFMVPVAPTTLVADLPKGIETVMLRALAGRPEERYNSVTEFLIALKATLQPKPPLFPFAHLTAPEALQTSIVEREKEAFSATSLYPHVLTEDKPDEEDLQLTDQATSPQYSFPDARSDMQNATVSSDHDLNSTQLSQQGHVSETANLIEITTSAENIPEQIQTASTSSTLPVDDSEPRLINHATSSTHPKFTQPSTRYSLLLLVVATLFVVISAFLSPVASPTVAKALETTPESVASTSNNQPITIAPQPQPTSKAPIKPSKSPVSVSGVKPTVSPTKSAASQPRPTATQTVHQPQPTAVPGKTPTPVPTTAAATPTPASNIPCTGVAAWSSGVAYTGGTKVTYNGSLWQAKWWTENDVPGGSAGVWTSTSKC